MNGIIVKVDEVFQTPLTQQEIDTQLNIDKWSILYEQWDSLTVTTTSANKSAIDYMKFKSDNMGDAAVILWIEDWAVFNTDIFELKEAQNLAADAHQVLVQTIFGA